MLDFVGGARDGSCPDDGCVGSIEVTIQYFSGCPNWQDALRHVSEAARGAGVEVTVSTIAVETLEDAERLAFTGSPTIQLDGVDPFVVAGAAPALACRVYLTETGPAGAPSVPQLTAALRAPASPPCGRY